MALIHRLFHGLALMATLVPSSLIAQGAGVASKLYPVADQQGKRHGYINGNGTLIVPLAYEGADQFSEGMGRVTQNGLCGYVNPVGQLIIACLYQRAASFVEGAAAVKLKDKWGLINKDGTWLTDQFTGEVGSFHSGMATLNLGEKWTFISAKSLKPLPEQYEAVQTATEGLAAVQAGGLWGFIDAEGTMQIPPQFQSVAGFSCGRAQVTIEGKTGFIDRTGRVVIKGLSKTSYFFENYAVTRPEEGESAVIDVSGRIMPIPPCEALDLPGEGWIAAQQRGSWGYIAINAGRWAISPQYAEAEPFKNGRAVVVNARGRFGMIDRKRKTVIPFQFGFLGDFDGPLAPMSTSAGFAIQEFGYVDQHGAVKWPPKNR